MSIVEVRRHAETRRDRTVGASELSDEGVQHARLIAMTAPRFNHVISSIGTERGVETAAAMGYPVDRRVDMSGGSLLGTAFDEIGGFHAWRGWENPFAVFQSFTSRGGPTAELARLQTSIWASAAEAVADHEAALVISHGGLVECGLASLFTEHELATWGPSFWNLEGARLARTGLAWELESLLRVPWRASSAP